MRIFAIGNTIWPRCKNCAPVQGHQLVGGKAPDEGSARVGQSAQSGADLGYRCGVVAVPQLMLCAGREGVALVHRHRLTVLVLGPVHRRQRMMQDSRLAHRLVKVITNIGRVCSGAVIGPHRLTDMTIEEYR